MNHIHASLLSFIPLLSTLNSMPYQSIIIILLIYSCTFCNANRPHIIYILCDDMGWNDVGFTGLSDLQTPNIDALAFHGRILTQHYALPTCTPSRSALLTGKYAIRTGMQGYPLSPSEPRALPLYERLMPEYFKDLGYQTHLVGKWHLGYYKWKFTPTLRKAFDTHFGYFNGFIGYFSHDMFVRNMTGHDLWRNKEPQYQFRGRYLTDLLTDESIRLIESTAHQQDASPLFLLLAHQAPHAGNPGDNDLEYHEEDINRFLHISDERRRKYAAMVWSLDKSVGRIVETLEKNNMLNNSIIVFSSDNGAQTIGMYANHGSNYPLKGLKFTVFEGGVRTVAAVWSPQLHTLRRGIYHQLFHISDWLPTLYTAAGGNPRDLSGLDGRDQWQTLLSENSGQQNKDEFAVRKELLVNIEEVVGQQALRYKQWKLVKGAAGRPSYDNYWGTPTFGNNYREIDVLGSTVSVTLSNYFQSDNLTAGYIEQQRSSTTLRCSINVSQIPHNKRLCVDSPCLFNIRNDPCESLNLAQIHPDIVHKLLAKLETYMQLLKPQLNVPNEDDLANPKLHNATWMPWHEDLTAFQVEHDEIQHCSRQVDIQT